MAIRGVFLEQAANRLHARLHDRVLQVGDQEIELRYRLIQRMQGFGIGLAGQDIGAKAGQPVFIRPISPDRLSTWSRREVSTRMVFSRAAARSSTRRPARPPAAPRLVGRTATVGRRRRAPGQLAPPATIAFCNHFRRGCSRCRCGPSLLRAVPASPAHLRLPARRDSRCRRMQLVQRPTLQRRPDPAPHAALKAPHPAPVAAAP